MQKREKSAKLSHFLRIEAGERPFLVFLFILVIFNTKWLAVSRTGDAIDAIDAKTVDFFRIDPQIFADERKMGNQLS